MKGFTGIDISPTSDADIIHDLNVYPWPIESDSVKEARCIHYVEHIPHYVPGYDVDGWFLFWNEMNRILRKGAKVTVAHPYSRCDRAFWDPTHTRYVHEMTWYYLDKNWREENHLDHYPIDGDFEVVLINGTGVPDSVTTRTLEQQDYMRAWFWNVVADLEVTLKKR